MTTHEFRVMGTPEPQGSARAFVRGKRAIITSDNKDLSAWRQAVRYEAQRYVEEHKIPCASRKMEAVRLEAVFRFHRPTSISKRIQLHNKRPDLDKLLRAIGDALTGIVYEDDGQIDRIAGYKKYAKEGEPSDVAIQFEIVPIKW